MSEILYEHPLNERVRNYLKLEQLFEQIQSSLGDSFVHSYPLFFNAFFSILDILDRHDIRGDLIKDLEKLERNLTNWGKSPEVDGNALQSVLEKAKSLSTIFRSKSPLWAALKKDKFLDGLRKRFTLQSAYSGFDLPALTFWFNQPPIIVREDINRWLVEVNSLERALTLVLKFIRQKAEFENIESNNSFYQDSGEGLLMLRVKLNKGVDYFPSVSGNHFRYSIRFMELCEQKGQQYINDKVSFKLAKC
ncbi:cell division protein ZapD [Thalassotalea mangrovi]|uniref:Cell division protein ZapD n=1 Tax=Thalassotalea mangrovi TaxID=2572245 RepID=A0A4U1B8W2_9GAMM|nr:cell division protein ZapD [Thalassotalea mangrovi]TKB47063.1 cell division protein ZapD [Thalassotalea mangrovi]